MSFEQYYVPDHDVTFALDPAAVSELSKTPREERIVGQPRALQALELGTRIRARGYNVFVTGPAGTGRHAAVKRVLEGLTLDTDTLKDIAYVYNFKNSYYPTVLFFPPGKASEFKRSVHKLVENLKTIVKAKLENEAFLEQREEIITVIESRENQILSEFEARLLKDNFEIIQVQDGDAKVSDIAPRYNGERTTFQDLQNKAEEETISEAELTDIREKYYSYMGEMERIFTDLRAARSMMEEELDALRKDTVKPDIHIEVDRIRERFQDGKIDKYLTDLEEDLLINLYLFTSEDSYTDERGNPALVRYGVNILVDSGGREEVPVIFENHPDYINLFGNIETHAGFAGELRTSFMMVRAGSLLNASGGSLVLRLADLIREEGVWENLKRVLQTGVLQIRHAGNSPQMSVQGIKPEPIEIDVKIIIIADEHMYEVLYNKEPDFKELFKLPAEFAAVMPRTEENTAHLIRYCRRSVCEEKTKPLTDDGIAEIVSYAVRIAERKDELTARLSLLRGLIVEADYRADLQNKTEIDREAVTAALAGRAFLSNMPEEKLDEWFRNGELSLIIKDSQVGRVNGLGLYERGFYTFGRPVGISAGVAPGEEGVVNIEREAGLSGESHDKGMLILEGFIRNRFAQHFPLSICATVCFEHSNDGIEGDSASSAELYALLSALSRFPLRQDIAVTGSVTQSGKVQAVSGITKKVEGFYRVCSKLGLTGTQGVIIPKANIDNLVVHPSVQKAVEEGTFSLYAVETIDQGMEILTGKQAGVRSKDGMFPSDSINGTVESTLSEMAENIRRFNRI